MIDHEVAYLGGMSGETSRPLFNPVPLQTVAQLAREDAWGDRGPLPDLDPLDLAECGWGVVFPRRTDRAVVEALRPLLDLRKEQAGKRYLELVDGDGCEPRQDYLRFLQRCGVGPGPADPDRLPYYLLLVGRPDEISFDFQADLDLTYAVGRLDLETPEDYARYAATVVAAERRELALPRSVGIFAPLHAGDAASAMGVEHLAAPLARELRNRHGDWRIDEILAEEATRARFLALLGSAGAPALIFTAGHGMGFGGEDRRQRGLQGAILCADWKGRGDIARKHYLAAEDLDGTAVLAGRMAFHFACYGAGTPARDPYPSLRADGRARITSEPFVSALPKRLLSHPNGSALAVIGHIERAWSFSFSWPGAGAQTQCFRSILTLLMRGGRVGHALDAFGQRSADLANTLLEARRQRREREMLAPETVSGLWTARNDARNWILLGDPAVRLPIEKRQP